MKNALLAGAVFFAGWMLRGLLEELGRALDHEWMVID